MTNTLEFDSKVSKKDLIDFKLYHNFHSFNGWFGVVAGIVFLVFGTISINKTTTTYTLMLYLFAVMFGLYPILNMILSANKQSKMEVFANPMHYKVTTEKLTLSQGQLTEDLTWDNIYKIKFSGKNLLIYINTTRANILTVDTMNEKSLEFVNIAKTKLKPFQIKVNESKLKKVVNNHDKGNI